jgi:hypothetical protein
LFAFEDSGRFVLHAFADHDFTANVHEIEHSAHRIACRRIGCLLVTATQPAQRIQCSRLGRANEIELNDPLDIPIILFRQSQSHGASIFTHLIHNDKSGGRVGMLCRLMDVTVQRRTDAQEKLESVTEIVSVVAVKTIWAIVDGELRAEPDVEAGAVR